MEHLLSVAPVHIGPKEPIGLIPSQSAYLADDSLLTILASGGVFTPWNQQMPLARAFLGEDGGGVRC